MCWSAPPPSAISWSWDRAGTANLPGFCSAPSAGNAPTPGGFDEILGKIGFPQGGDKPAGGRSRETPIEAAAKSAARAIGSEVGRRVIRGVLGSIFGGSRR